MLQKTIHVKTDSGYDWQGSTFPKVVNSQTGKSGFWPTALRP